MPELDVATAPHSGDGPAAADVVVGIPSYNNARSIGDVVRAVRAGLSTYFPSLRGVIVHSDGGSADGTAECVRTAVGDGLPLVQVTHPLHLVHKLATTPLGVPGKGNALQAIFRSVQKLDARACAIVTPDVLSITPQWIDLLVRPLLEQEFDFSAPCYSRHKYDGAITSAIVYPVTRALYGKRVRQPVDGDFGFSRRLVDHVLTRNVWDQNRGGFGTDLWMTTEAICGGFRLCQAVLGRRILNGTNPVSDLSSLLVQILGPLFTEMERNVSTWQRTRGSEDVPVFGSGLALDVDPVPVNVTRQVDAFCLGFETLWEVWSLVLSPAVLVDLKRLTRLPQSEFRMPDQAWVRAVYDFGLAHRLRVIPRDHLLRAFTPIYLGWVGSFMLEMQNGDARAVEARFERLCLTYEAQKPYLISRWRWPDRFTT